MANTYLEKTNPVAGSRQKGTISFWVKRGKLGSSEFLYVEELNSTDNGVVYFSGGNTFNFINYNGGSPDAQLSTNRLFRDTSAWYHIVIAWDTTQGTAADRIKMYINGEQETSFSTATYPSLNANLKFGIGSPGGSNYDINIGRRASGDYFTGSITHFHRVDNQQLDASVFGETDANGVWKIKTSPTITYTGSSSFNFFILKNGNSVTDQSGNGNNFTVAGGTLTNTEDNPSNVFCNFMSHTTSSYMTISNGGTTLLGNTATDSGNSLAGLGVSSGKWYFEVKITVAVNGYPILGYVKTTDSEFGHQNANGGGGDPAPRIYGFTNASTYNGSSSTSNLSFSNGDIIGFAFDLDNGAVYFSQNGTFINSSDPTSGASKTNAQVSFSPDGETYTLFCGSYNNSKAEFNFGNGYFGTTAVASAGTNASGIGIFEHDVPTGYTALSTKGLNL